MTPEIPPRPDIEPPAAGKLAEHFGSYSCRQLVDLFRQLLPSDADDEDEAAAEARAGGEMSHLDVLAALHQRGTREVFDMAETLCRHPEPRERVIGLRILRELGPAGSRPVFEEIWALLDEMAGTEEDPGVLYWVLACLRFTGDPRILDTLVRFSTHPDEAIRRGIAFSIVDCGPEDPRVIAVQLRLAEDPVADIRALAVYDLVNEITRTPHTSGRCSAGSWTTQTPRYAWTPKRH